MCRIRREDGGRRFIPQEREGLQKNPIQVTNDKETYEGVGRGGARASNFVEVGWVTRDVRIWHTETIAGTLADSASSHLIFLRDMQSFSFSLSSCLFLQFFV